MRVEKRTAEHVPGNSCHVQRFAARVALDQRHHVRRKLARFVLQAANAQAALQGESDLRNN